jgi:undecaprenyl-diphosphatase
MSELSLWKILVLAVIQGITEFLPISSDGHLAIAMPLLCGGKSPEGMLGVTVMLHLGTLLSIIVFYWQRILELVARDRWTMVTIVVGSIPAAVIGLLLEKYAEPVLESTLLAGAMLFVTGGLLLFLRSRPEGKTEYQQLSLGRAFIIGLFQASAILPGLSRSGSTIASGVGVGLTRGSAATYSFLLAIPAVGGAVALKAGKAWLGGEALGLPWLSIVAGVIVSFVVGWVALWFLNRWLARGKLHYFAWYCFALGGIVVAWQCGFIPFDAIATR